MWWVLCFNIEISPITVYPKKYAHGFCFAVLCCGYTLTDFPISIRLTSLALWQSNDCPSGSKATLMNMEKYFMWIHYERLHNHNKAKHNKTVCIFLGIYCSIDICSTIHILGRRQLYTLGLYSLSGKTSYRKISWSLEAARFGFKLSNHSEIWQVPRQRCCRGACQISERYEHCNFQSRGFETSRDLAVRRLTT